MKKTLNLIVLLMAALFYGCVATEIKPEDTQSINTGDIPNATIGSKLRNIVGDVNEVTIAKSFVDSDPTFVLGSVVNMTNGEVMFESFLKENAEPKVEIKTELWERKLIEKDLALSASYLSFISGSLTDKKKAEVTLIKNSVTSAARKDIDFESLKTQIKSKKDNEIPNFGIILQYTDFVLTALVFEEAEKKADATGYGAKISGKWHNKIDNKDMDRVVVATYFPLKSVLELIDSVDENTPLIEILKMENIEFPANKPSSIIFMDNHNAN